MVEVVITAVVMEVMGKIKVKILLDLGKNLPGVSLLEAVVGVLMVVIL